MNDGVPDISEIVDGLMEDRSLPKNIKTSLKESLSLLNLQCSPEERISCIISALDEAGADQNVSMHARTIIWSAISTLEGIKGERLDY
jgi:uncharacterized protein